MPSSSNDSDHIRLFVQLLFVRKLNISKSSNQQAYIFDILAMFALFLKVTPSDKVIEISFNVSEETELE